jgi:hypothetical protein
MDDTYKEIAYAVIRQLLAPLNSEGLFNWGHLSSDFAVPPTSEALTSGFFPIIATTKHLCPLFGQAGDASSN